MRLASTMQSQGHLIKRNSVRHCGPPILHRPCSPAATQTLACPPYAGNSATFVPGYLGCSRSRPLRWAQQPRAAAPATPSNTESHSLPPPKPATRCPLLTHLDTSGQDLLLGGLLHKGRSITVDGPVRLGVCSG
jgi:hypothetical protein